MRHMQRQVRQTLSDHLAERLTALGWIDEPRVFGLDRPVRLVDVDPDELLGASFEATQELRSRLEGYVVSVTIEEEDEDRLEELGGPLHSVVLNVAVDVWGELTSITMALASDVKDSLARAFIPVHDYASGVTTSNYIEPEVVRIIKPSGNVVAADFKKKWRIVTLDAHVVFTAEAVS